MRSLVEKIAVFLKPKGSMLCTAESCTGGLIAKLCTDLAGSSAWFECGVVTYSNASKTALLGVPEEVISEHGAVSEETAFEMAYGALLNFINCKYSISVTGIAGPGGGSDLKPVGTVCFGFGLRSEDGEIQVQTRVEHFSGDREEIRNQSAHYALETFLAIAS
ncbi:CinA family protein [Taylorella equigenitalis]|uniref:CinA family protein n=1 Tax=Taylorella equigenitalis TaxID=29575 RepID=UPI0004085C02|nr:nicotinamide-nucleotide amidohydrolase family protein [Taylorella equigenitalis]ASY30118.1 competence protein [Taylorella equigenitalis]KOS58706.1 competence protein [Taylorella equigenitalis]